MGIWCARWAMRPMVPAKDLEISKRFYAGLVINLKTA
jgi:hypothetical protein